MKVKVYVTYHEEKRSEAKAIEICKQKEELFIPRQVYSNKFFEAAAFKNAQIVDDTVDFVGHVTYSYKSKIAPYDFEDLCKKYSDTTDVIALFPGNNFPMYDFAEKVHPGFMKIWDRLMELMGHKDYMSQGSGQPQAFYSNYWIARRDLWNKYCEFAASAMHHLTSDPLLIELCQQDSGYKGTIEALPPPRLQEICGKPYYTFEPFIMERLPCFFFHSLNARTKLITVSTQETWNNYAAFSGASFVLDNKKNRVL